MVNEKKRRAIEMLREGVTQSETARRVGVSKWEVWKWKREEQGNVKCKTANEKCKTDSNSTTGEGEREENANAELERLKRACLVAVMKELKKRLRGAGIKEIEAKDLLAIVDRVGKLSAEESGSGTDASRAATGSEGEGEGSLIGRMSDETRKRIYEVLVGEAEGTEGDAAQG